MKKILAALSCAVALIAATALPVSGSAPAAGPIASYGLPFLMPQRAVLTAGPLVLAHYFIPFPLSIDNKPADDDYYSREYLSRSGENGKHATAGGYLRDRPLRRPPIAGDWKSADYELEIRQAVAAGLDGFAIELLSREGLNFDRAANLITAGEAADPTFTFLLTPDMNVDAYKLATADELVAALVKLAVLDGKLRPSTYRKDGKLVINPFKTDNRPPAFWSEVKEKFTAATGGLQIYLWGSFLDWRQQAAAYAEVADGYMSWGQANLTRSDPAALAAAAVDARAQGKSWMQALHPYDQRPGANSRGLVFDESWGTEAMRRQWAGAIAGKADAVQFVTWNDYTETAVAPSAGHGSGPLDVSAYYIAAFKTGHYPEITRDAIYLSHRSQFTGAVPACAADPITPCATAMRVRSGTTEPVNVVEVLTMLTAPSQVDVTVGQRTSRISAPAGVSRSYVNLQTGVISAVASRGGKAVAAVDSPYIVAEHPAVQDMQYHMVSSLRPAPAPPVIRP